MMPIHKEGRKFLFVFSLIAILIAYILNFRLNLPPFALLILDAGLLVLSGILFWFFRIPRRKFRPDEGLVSSPVDGKVVVIERVYESEYFKETRIQVSIFMSVFNPHVNFAPMSGRISYFKYHPGDYFLALHPKSSALNERTSIGIQGAKGSILMRQIAGAVARRIVWYCKPDDTCSAGEEIGFIKFGSRIDLLLPESARIEVAVGQKVTAGHCIIASL